MRKKNLEAKPRIEAATTGSSTPRLNPAVATATIVRSPCKHTKANAPPEKRREKPPKSTTRNATRARSRRARGGLGTHLERRRKGGARGKQGRRGEAQRWRGHSRAHTGLTQAGRQGRRERDVCPNTHNMPLHNTDTRNLVVLIP